MNLSMEIPISLLEVLSPLCDLDFALAHEVLDGPKEYREFYAEQSKRDRLIIMDNGFHEKGHPLEPKELVHAASMIRPTYVIAPDMLGDQKRTLEGFFALKAVQGELGGAQLGVVIQGKSPAERAELFMKTVKDAGMICFPFKEARFEWYCDLLEKIPRYVQWPPRIHLLGVNELWELKAFRDKFIEQGIPRRRLSVDTSKPIKFGLAAKRIEADTVLRGLGPLKQIDGKVALDRLCDIFYNISFLRKYL